MKNTFASSRTCSTLPTQHRRTSVAQAGMVAAMSLRKPPSTMHGRAGDEARVRKSSNASARMPCAAFDDTPDMTISASITASMAATASVVAEPPLPPRSETAHRYASAIADSRTRSEADALSDDDGCAIAAARFATMRCVRVSPPPATALSAARRSTSSRACSSPSHTLADSARTVDRSASRAASSAARAC